MGGGAGTDPSVRDLGDIDRMVHEPARLMILMVLFTVESADFTFLNNATELTDGNLSSHLAKLEQAGYVLVDKGYAGKKPRTLLSLTEEGRKAVDAYRKLMEQALHRLG